MRYYSGFGDFLYALGWSAGSGSQRPVQHLPGVVIMVSTYTPGVTFGKENLSRILTVTRTQASWMPSMFEVSHPVSCVWDPELRT